MESKLTHLQKWLAANTGKTERDWLFEVRCIDDTQRQKLTEILEVCDRKGVEYVICYPVKAVYDSNGEVSSVDYPPLSKEDDSKHDSVLYGDAIFFDVAFQKPNELIYVFDMDTPDCVYDFDTKYARDAALRYLTWKIKDSKEIGTPAYNLAHELNRQDSSFALCEDFIDWRSPEFYYYLKA